MYSEFPNFCSLVFLVKYSQNHINYVKNYEDLIIGINYHTFVLLFIISYAACLLYLFILNKFLLI
jgi:uncharacterized protein HemY